MLAGNGKFQGAKLEKILHLHQRDPGTLLGSSEAIREKEGGGPRISPSSPGPGALGVQKWVQGIERAESQGGQWTRLGSVGWGLRDTRQWRNGSGANSFFIGVTQ